MTQNSHRILISSCALLVHFIDPGRIDSKHGSAILRPVQHWLNVQMRRCAHTLNAIGREQEVVCTCLSVSFHMLFLLELCLMPVAPHEPGFELHSNY